MNKAQIIALVNTSLSANYARLGGSKDIEAIRKEKGAFAFTESTAEYIEAAKIEENILASIFPNGAMNPKAQKRFIQMVNALQEKKFEHIDLTTLRAMLALRESSGTLNRDALFNLLTGKVKTEGITPNHEGISLTQLDKAVGRVGRGSVETQLSRSFGENGFAKYLGMVSTDGRSNFAVTVHKNNLLAKRLFAMVDKASKAQLESMQAKTA